MQTFTLKVEYPSCRAFKRQGCMPLFCRRAGFVIIAALLSIQETRNPQGRQQQLCFPSVCGRDLGSSVVCQPAGNLIWICGASGQKGLLTPAESTSMDGGLASVPSVAPSVADAQGGPLAAGAAICLQAGSVLRPACSSRQTRGNETALTGSRHRHQIFLTAMESCTSCHGTDQKIVLPRSGFLI